MSPVLYDPSSGTFSSNGRKFKQLWQLIPMLKPYYFDFENTYDIRTMQTLMIKSSWVPIVTVIIYIILCFSGVQIMKNYKNFDLKAQLAFWNLALSLFSAWGTFRTAPHLLHNIFNRSFEYTICEDPVNEWGVGATGFAVQLFILSKFPELIDTLFIVLKKKPLIFLHWYHHITVLLYCWNAYVTEAGSGLYFVVMNYAVHAIMYFYYFMQSIHCVPKSFPSWIITLLQISQMFIGIFVVSSAIYYHNYGGTQYGPSECHNRMSNMIAGAIMYSSYALLFLIFAIERYVFKRKSHLKLTLKVSEKNGKGGDKKH